jgi:hypothetical protein
MMPGFVAKRLMSLSKMSDDILQSSLSDDYGLNKARGWKLKLCWLPKKCFLSSKVLWGKNAYHAQRIITGPGDPVIEDYWLEKFEFMKWQLTRT